MPIVLQPLPRRIRRTHENLRLEAPTVLSIPPDADEAITAALRETLEPLFPEIQQNDSADPDTLRVRFMRFDESEGIPEEIPLDVVEQAYRMTVGPQGVDVAAGSEIGWLLAARQLPGLREGEELTGIEILDRPSFPVRQIDLPWPASSISPSAYEALFRLLVLGRMNQLRLPGERDQLELPDEIRDSARRLGLRLVSSGGDPSFHLLERPAVFPHYSERMPALQAAALAADSEGRREFALSLGAVDSQTSLESLAYGILFAGDCAWNPQKVDLKAFRRTYALRRFGFDSRAPIQITDTLEEGSILAEAAAGGAEGARDLADPFDPRHGAGLTRPEEQAVELERRATAALAAMGPLQPDSEERAAALQGLQWTAQRLKRYGRLLGTAERVRELYRSAYVAAASPKAVSDRLLRAADLLESEARGLDEHRGEWHALWRRERQGPYDPEAEAALRAPGEALVARAARLRDLRSRYIQTGALPPPADEGLERTAARLTVGIVPARLPPQPSPAWWPEGGAARVRVDVDCPEPAAGIPWAVQADFRALAGEAGAFNIRSVRLIPLTESDEAGPEQPCQLLRTGFAFIAEPGRRSYYLYLDPDPAPDSGFREVRTNQSRSAVRLENRRMRLSLSPASGFISTWHLVDPELELLPEDSSPEGAPESTASEWRLRLIETGPLLARVRAEHPDGRVCQFDLAAGQRWIDVSANSPGEELLLPFREGLWRGSIERVLGTGAGAERRQMDGPITEEALWSGLHVPDGLTVGVVLPEGAAEVTLGADRLQVHRAPSGHWLLFGGREDDPGRALSGLAEAWQRPPQVRLGVFEHRRVREF